MEHFQALFLRAWADTWEIVIGAPMRTLMVGLFILFVSAGLTYVWKGWSDVRDLLFGSLIVVISTVSIFVLIFILNFLFLSPQRMVAESNVSRDNERALRIQSESRTAAIAVDLKASQDRATYLSDALATGKSDGLDEPIASASANIMVEVDTSLKIPVGNNPFIGGGEASFTSNGETILTAVSSESRAYQAEIGKGKYEINAQCLITSKLFGKPIKDLLEAKVLQVFFTDKLVPAETYIAGGQITWVINNRIILRFKIPTQKSVGRPGCSGIVVIDLAEGMRPIKRPSSSSTPDK